MSLITIGTMVLLILGTVVLFGETAEDGPLQAAMTFGLAAAMVIAKVGGNSAESLAAAIRSSIDSALGTVFVLLAVGALIGSLFLSGTIATVVYYGAQFGTPQILYILVLVLATVLALAIGSSFTTIAAVGLPFVALAPSMGVSPVVTAGAAVSGAMFGDSLSRISDTFLLTASVVGVKPSDHRRALRVLLAPGWVLSAVVFVVLGVRHGGQGDFDASSVQAAIESQFTVSPIAIVPLIVVLGLSARTTGFLALMAGAASAVVVAAFMQRELIAQVAEKTVSGAFGEWATASLVAMGEGFALDSGTDALDTTFSGGGVLSMLPTVWLILVAAAFGALVTSTGMLDRLLAPLLQWATGAFRLIVAAAATSIGMNAALADPYASIILSGTTFRDRFKAARLEPSVASVSVAGSGTIASPLIPWNVNGAFAAGTLGVATFAYAQYAVLLWVTPLLLLVLGLAVYRRDQLPSEQAADDSYQAASVDLPERRTSV
jgi:NhaC family Na+:H+ antiporter